MQTPFMNQSKTLGSILSAVGVGILLIGAVWALAGSIETTGGRILALFFVFVIAAPLIGIGLYVLQRGRAEAVEEQHVRRQQKLLGMVMTQGKVDISRAAIELNLNREQTRQLIYDLIAKQLFSGYVDWQDGALYSADAAKLTGGQCPKCGGKLELAGKGLIKCPYCGTEVFLSG